MLAEKLVQYLPDPNTVKENIGAVVERLQEEAPLLVQEILRWHILYNLVRTLAGLVLLVLVVSTVKVIYKAAKKYEDKHNDDILWLPAILWWMLGTGIGVVLIVTSLEWLQIMVAPRLFLIEYISKLIR